MAKSKSPAFDLEAAHKYFAAHCFNRAWDLIEKQDRSPEEELLMVALNQASLYHWSQRPDCTDQNRSVGYWQAARIQAILGNPAEARRYAEVCLSYSRDLEPFYLGYAFEALARAAKIAGDDPKFRQYLAAAEEKAASVPSKEDRELLEKDLAGLK
jgi:hypothetical protein